MRIFVVLVALGALVNCLSARVHAVGNIGSPNFQSFPELEDEECPKVVGGNTAYLGQIPYQALLLRNEQMQCGGTIICEKIVLTAAHCVVDEEGNVEPAKLFKVVVGIVSFYEPGETIVVEKIKVHEHYSSSSRANDIALLKLQQPVTPSETVRTIPLLRAGSPVEGQIGRVSGWGYNASDGYAQVCLQYVDVPIVNHARCEEQYENIISLPEGVVCAAEKRKDTCYGDSGGPLAIQGELAGVTSFGHGCADEAYPGVYTDVYVFRPWIEDNMENLRCTASKLATLNVVLFAIAAVTSRVLIS